LGLIICDKYKQKIDKKQINAMKYILKYFVGLFTQKLIKEI